MMENIEIALFNPAIQAYDPDYGTAQNPAEAKPPKRGIQVQITVPPKHAALGLRPYKRIVRHTGEFLSAFNFQGAENNNFTIYHGGLQSPEGTITLAAWAPGQGLEQARRTFFLVRDAEQPLSQPEMLEELRDDIKAIREKLGA